LAICRFGDLSICQFVNLAINNLVNNNKINNKRMKRGLFLITTAMLLASCSFFVDQAKDTVKKVSEISEEAATKAGEIVGGSARSFGDGVGEGIDKSGNMALQLSEELANAGVKLGAHTISSTDEGNDNKLSIYFIFEKDFQKTVVIKVLNKQQVEVGRIKQEVKGKKDEATYIDFVFDPRTNIDPKYTILVN